MKLIRKITLATLLAGGIALSASTTSAQDPGAEKAITGKVTSTDKTAQTVNIGSQTFQILPTTKITNMEKPASIDDIKSNQPVSGLYKLSAENKLELTSLDITGATGTGTTAESGTIFRGKVTKVDSAAQTVMIGNQTYVVLPTTKITKHNTQASFSDVKIGSLTHGTYKTSAENKMELTSLEIGTPGAIGGTGNDVTTQTGNTFSGKISKIDPLTQTVTVGNRTYQMLPTTTLTTGAGRPATLANLKANQQVTGTYKQADSGKMELLSLQVSNQ